MNKITLYTSLVREYLFPSDCALCGKMLLEGADAWYGLCHDCRDIFPIGNERRCSSCGRPLISEQDRCLQCREGDGHAFDGAFILYPYTGKYRKLLGAYKFGKYRALGNFLGEKLVEGLSRFPPPGMANPRWVPVPPRPGKIKHAGWDQIEYLAGRLEGMGRNNRKKTDLDPMIEHNTPEKTLFPAHTDQYTNTYPLVYRCLRRLPSTSQKELNRENRKTNLRGRIRCIKKPPAEVILFDDVFTTGSTLDACAQALKDGGAEKVYAVCLFYD
ncbi:amidophosphoribosyltransferase [Spirochaetia bacterium]|nr:amidophosphoribosyltransferase [Spirochaetia bacterium]